MIKRSKYINRVTGVHVAEDGSVEQTVIEVPGRCRNADSAKRQAVKRAGGNFIPTKAEQFAVRYGMDDAEFFAAAQIVDGGEPRPVPYSDEAGDDQPADAE